MTQNMELNDEIKLKLTERFIKVIGEPFSPVVEEIYNDLLCGEHSVEVSTHKKYTIVEITYPKNGYTHHFLGVSAKHPNDDKDAYYGLKIAMNKALGSLIQKFYLEEQLKLKGN